MQELNPYSPPKSSSTAAPEYYGDAGRGRRFLNLLIDTLVYYFLAFVVGLSWALLGGDTESLGAYVIGCGVMLTYYLVFEGTTGRTLGKLVTGTRVVAADDGRVTLGRLLGRTLSRFVPFEPFSFLGGGPGWHDTWSSTRVVLVRRPRNYVDEAA